MKKFLPIATVVIIIVLLYLFCTRIFEYTKVLSVYVENRMSENISSTKDSVNFLDTPENEILTASAIKIAKDLKASTTFEKVDEKTLLNAYTMRTVFPSFYSYYATRVKIEKSVYERLQWLYSSVSSLTQEQLKTYYTNNTTYIESYFGLTSYEDFNNFIIAISEVAKSPIVSCEVMPNSVHYDSAKSAAFCRIKIENTNGDFVYLSVLSYTISRIENQTSPAVVFLGATGGVS